MSERKLEDVNRDLTTARREAGSWRDRVEQLETELTTADLSPEHQQKIVDDAIAKANNRRARNPIGGTR